MNLNAVLHPAQRAHYAVGLFNAVNLEQAMGIIAAAEEMRSPVIIGTAEILLPYAPLAHIADILLPVARRASVPVVINYDHGLTFDKCMEALKLGFSSIMYDCSTASYEENVRNVAEMVRIAHAFGATVEGELGHVGGSEDDNTPDDHKAFFTDPEKSKDYVRSTNVDALAIAVGNAHGVYKFPPKLDFDRIDAIAAAVDVPLVLHGGSGLSDEDFYTAIRKGIAKVNIFTDVNVASANGCKQALAEGKNCMTDMMPYSVQYVKQAVENKMLLFGSTNRV